MRERSGAAQISYICVAPRQHMASHIGFSRENRSQLSLQQGMFRGQASSGQLTSGHFPLPSLRGAFNC